MLHTETGGGTENLRNRRFIPFVNRLPADDGNSFGNFFGRLRRAGSRYDNLLLETGELKRQVYFQAGAATDPDGFRYVARKTSGPGLNDVGAFGKMIEMIETFRVRRGDSVHTAAAREDLRGGARDGIPMRVSHRAADRSRSLGRSLGCGRE